MKRGPYHTLSGWPIGSLNDMEYHRATGEQIPKARAEGIVGKGPKVEYVETQPGAPGFDGSAAYEHYLDQQYGRDLDRPRGFDTMDAERLMLDSEAFLRGGRTTIYVGDDVDFDKLAMRDDLPEGVEIVTVNPALFPDGWDGVVIDDSPKIDPDEFGKLAADMQAAFAKVDYSGMARMAEGLATAVGSVAENIGKAYLDIETRTSNYPLFDGYPRFEDTDWYRMGRIRDSQYFVPTRLSAVTDKNAKRVAKDRARNKAARKQRQQRRK